MAELAIPLLGLGALYVISNKDNNKDNKKSEEIRENFLNMGKNENILPNTPVDPVLFFAG